MPINTQRAYALILDTKALKRIEYSSMNSVRAIL